MTAHLSMTHRRWPHPMRALLALAIGWALVIGLAPLPASASNSTPYFQLPFTCSEVWQGDTYAGHEAGAVDFKRSGALGKPVRASAAGTVTSIYDDDGTVPHIVVITHWNGWTTHYAHMTNISVVKNQAVAYGDVIGKVGAEGNATGPHLHYVQKRNGVGQTTRFNNVTFVPTTTPKSITSRNCPDGTPFADTVDSAFRADIKWVYDEGIAGGCAVDEYCPTGLVTREQMAAFLDRFLGLANTSADYFTDDESSPFEQSINNIAAAGITSGCGAGKYCPTNTVSRAEMATFLDRALNLPDTTVDYFTDDETSPHEQAINNVRAAEIAFGCTATTFCPNNTVNREQMAAFLHRAGT